MLKLMLTLFIPLLVSSCKMKQPEIVLEKKESLKELGDLIIMGSGFNFGLSNQLNEQSNRSFTFQNKGNNNAKIKQVALKNSTGQFQLNSLDECLDKVIAPTESCEIDIVYNPNAEGIHRQAVEVKYDDGAGTKKTSFVVSAEVDLTPPEVKEVTIINSNGLYLYGQDIYILIRFTENVVVNTDLGTPRLQLETGATDRYAQYVSGSGGDLLFFRYTVSTNDLNNDLDYVSENALEFNLSEITDLANNTAILTLPPVGTLAAAHDIMIDGDTALINEVSFATADGFYKLNDQINLRIKFNMPVNVDTSGGIPSIELETGTIDAEAFYTAGSGTDTLNFRYTIASGDESLDLDYKSIESLKLNGGRIYTPSSLEADLTLPAPGTLSSNYNIVVDTVAPTDSGIAPSFDQLISNGRNLAVSWNHFTDNDQIANYGLKTFSNSSCDQDEVDYGLTNDTSNQNSSLIDGLTSGTYWLKVYALDRAGHTTESTCSTTSITVDSVAPVVTGLIVNDGSGITNSPNVDVHITAIDTGLGITHLCLKYLDLTTPKLNDSCWSSVTKTSSLILTHATSLGKSALEYTVYGWVKDEAGNISTLSANSLGTDLVDRFAIEYKPGDPPEVVGVIASNTNIPSNPILNSQLDVSAGTVVIKWKVNDKEGLDGEPINLFYTTDDKEYHRIDGPLADTSAPGCDADAPGTTLDDGFTGCYVWSTDVPSGYFKVLVEAIDESSQSTKISNILNPGKVNIIAGNTDLGTNSSAINGFFHGFYNTRYWSMIYTMAIADDGTMYINDLNRGIIKISPEDGISTVLIPVDLNKADNFGDGGPVSAATVRSVNAIALDHQNNLYIHDTHRIRKVDTSVTPNTINTIIGGGTNNGETVANALDLRLSTSINHTTKKGYSYQANELPLYILPNGEIFFASGINDPVYGNIGNATPGNGYFFRRYRPGAENEITTVRPSGIGTFYKPTADVTTCNHSEFAFTYDPQTSAISNMSFYVRDLGDCSLAPVVITDGYVVDPETYESLGQAHAFEYNNGDTTFRGKIVIGMNGKMYSTSRANGKVYVFEEATKTWKHILGAGYGGQCKEDQPATTCNIELEGFFVTKSGKIYYRSRGAIYTITKDDTVKLVYGQNFSYGEGLPPTVARFKNIQSFGLWNNGGNLTISTMDTESALIREFTLTGTVTTIAGNGIQGGSTYTVPATETALTVEYSNYNRGHMVQNYNTGEIYNVNSAGQRIIVLNRTTGRWESVIGGASPAAYPYLDSNIGKTGSQLTLPNVTPIITGIDTENSQLLVHHHQVDRLNIALRLYDYSDSYRMSALAGNTSPSNTTLADYSVQNCSNYDENNNYVEINSSDCILPHGISSGIINTFDSIGDRWLYVINNDNWVHTFGRTNNVKDTLLETTQVITAYDYYRTANEELFFYCDNFGNLREKNIKDGTPEVILPHNITGLKCKGSSLRYIPSRNSIIFIYSQNGLNGIAEYFR